MSTGGRDPGLAAERTALAWTRTSLALLANGALVLVRHLRPEGGPAELALALGAAALAVVFALVGRSRSRLLRRGAIPAASRAPLVLGVLVVALCAGVTVALLG